jgi:hypothetical protein
MDSFWGNLLEHFKSRSAWIFVPALLIFFALILLSQYLVDSLLSNNLPDISSEDVIRFSLYVMPAVVVLLVAGIGSRIRHRRARRRKRYESSTLSRDELTKARSKLGKTKI